MNLSRPLALMLMSAGLLSTATAADAYYRFPAVRGDSVVFTAEGDLWRTSAHGGQAQRLTTHPSAETNAAISQDGRWVAFSASYEGAQEAYVMPLAGGLPKRITFENGAVSVLGWSAQGEVLVSMADGKGPGRALVIAAVKPDDLQRRIFPLADANDAVLDDAGKTLYFTRNGLAMTNDNVKHYRGGAYAQLWRYELGGNAEATQLLAPIWATTSGRCGGRAGSTSSATAAARTICGHGRRRQRAAPADQHTDWDVRNAALGDGRIVYQLGADLHVLDLATSKDEQLAINLVSDFDQQRTRQIRSPLDSLTNVQIAGKFERIVLTARGRVSVAGTGAQRRVEIAIPEGARARQAVFSHDDKSIYAIVDSSGENEIWKFAADGSGKGEQLTKDGNNHRWQLYPSPDGRWLGHTDKKGRFWLLDLATKANTVIDDAGKVGLGEYDEILWSPDSKNLALVRAASTEQRDQIGLYNIEASSWPSSPATATPRARRCSRRTASGCTSSRPATSSWRTARRGATAIWARVRQAHRHLRAGAAAGQPLPVQAG
jgi:tricorn protease